jgi:hypothetical protein
MFITQVGALTTGVGMVDSTDRSTEVLVSMDETSDLVLIIGSILVLDSIIHSTDPILDMDLVHIMEVLQVITDSGHPISMVVTALPIILGVAMV